MSQQPGYPYGQPQPGQSQGYPGAAGPNYAAPGTPQYAQYSAPGAQQAQPYGTPGGPQSQPYGTPGAPQSQPYATPGGPQSQPYGTPSGAHPTPYSTPGIPQTSPHGAPPSHQQAYSTPDVVQHTAYGAQPQMPGYGVPMAGNPYGTQAPAPAPAQPVDPMWASFSAVAGADQKIDAVELCKCLTQSGFTGSYKPFTQETCKILITLLDRNKTGKMGFTEYKELWIVLGKWKQTFESLDKDRSGSLDEQELKSAIISFGYSLSPTALASVMQRYNTNGKIYFDDFIALTTRVRSLSAFFRSRDTTGQGTATLGYDDFITYTMAC